MFKLNMFLKNVHAGPLMLNGTLHMCWSVEGEGGGV